MFYNARWYDPYLNHFTQPDSIVPDPYNPQDWNRYSYARNNPLKYTDPTGHMISESDGGGGCSLPKCGQSTTKSGGSSNTNIGCGLGCILNGLHKAAELINTVVDAYSGKGHSYSTNAHYVCLPVSWINCTGAETDDYLSRFQYPGQLPSQPAVAGANYNVFPEKFPNGENTFIGDDWPGSGHIRIAKNGNTVTNVAFPEHIFDGVVDRTKSHDKNGVPMVTTVGRGVNTGFDVYNGYTIPGPVIDIANHYIGPFTFTQIDKGLLLYTTWVETVQYFSDAQQPK
jgi:hypothetical protein